LGPIIKPRLRGHENIYFLIRLKQFSKKQIYFSGYIVCNLLFLNYKIKIFLILYKKESLNGITFQINILNSNNLKQYDV